MNLPIFFSYFLINVCSLPPVSMTGTASLVGGDCTPTLFEAAPANPGNPDLAAVEARMREAGIIRASFEQTKKITALRRPLKSSGRFLFAQEKGIYWQTVEPIQNLFVLSPKGILQKSAGADPVVIETGEQPVIHGFIQIFMSLFGGDTSELDRRFERYFAGTGEGWTIGLKPKGAVMKKLFDHILLCGGQTIETVVFTERTGDQTSISFSVNREGPAQLTGEELANFDF